jgi:hypothetical protein
MKYLARRRACAREPCVLERTSARPDPAKEFTASFDVCGLWGVRGDVGALATERVKTADSALYESKCLGRNRLLRRRINITFSLREPSNHFDGKRSPLKCEYDVTGPPR